MRERARDTCEYCRSQARYGIHPFSVDHIIPTSAGGTTSLDNLAWTCQGCNNSKYAKTTARDPVTREFEPLFHPRQQRWNEHFTWSKDFAFVIGLTPTGRATVEALHLNREGVINLRKLLYSAGEHPPDEIK